MSKHYLAIDLGASSGRVIDAAFDGQRVTLDEVHRFENRVVRVHDGSDTGRYHWDYLRLWDSIQDGLKLTAGRGIVPDSIGIDTWGVDYALLGKSGRLAHMPTAYRDPRTNGVYEQVRAKLTDARIYERTGVQFMPINTLYQLACDALDPDRPLERAASFLQVPDLLGYWMTGNKANEHTFASTTQCYDAVACAWATDLLGEIGVPGSIFETIRQPGDREPLGTLTRHLAEQTGLNAATRVGVIGSHDTASAIVAAPIIDPARSAYISSGTWSLVGLELDAPLRTPEAMSANFTNEAGVCGTTRFLKNCAGLWLVQECRRVWGEQGKTYDYGELMRMAEQATPLVSLFDPDDPAFATPGDMPARIRRACVEAGEPEPKDEAALVRAVLESLALRYDQLLRSAASLTGRTIQTLYIVGGGVANTLLNQLTADATGLIVIAGPAEATAMGNALVQAMGRGELAGLDEMRAVAGASSQAQQYEPSGDASMAERYASARARFTALSI